MRTSAVSSGMELLSRRVSRRLSGQKVFSILVAAIAILAASPIYAQPSRSARHVRRGREEAMSRRKARLDASKINNPDTRDFVGPHSEGEAVVRAAILLSRLKFSPGEITSRNSGGPGQEGTPTAAVRPSAAGEQAAEAPTITRDMPGSPPLAVATYVITLQDVSGPFTKFPRIRGRDAGQRQLLREARLPRLNFESPLDLLAEKFHSSARLLLQLNPGRRFDKAGEKIQVPNVLNSPPPQAGSVVG